MLWTALQTAASGSTARPATSGCLVSRTSMAIRFDDSERLGRGVEQVLTVTPDRLRDHHGDRRVDRDALTHGGARPEGRRTGLQPSVRSATLADMSLLPERTIEQVLERMSHDPMKRWTPNRDF